MRTISLLRLGVVATPLLALQPALAEAGQPLVLTTDQLDGIVAGLSVSVDASADASGTVTYMKTTAKTKVSQAGGKAVGFGVAVAVAKGSDCASSSDSCSAITSGSYTDGTGKVRTIDRTLKNGGKISITIVVATGSV